MLKEVGILFLKGVGFYVDVVVVEIIEWFGLEILMKYIK